MTANGIVYYCFLVNVAGSIVTGNPFPSFRYSQDKSAGFDL